MKVTITERLEDESYIDISIDDKKVATALVEFYDNGPQIKHVAARWGIPLVPIVKELSSHLYESHGEPYGIFASFLEGETDMKRAYEETGFMFFKNLENGKILYHLKRQ
jgi:hypothetical protein